MNFQYKSINTLGQEDKAKRSGDWMGKPDEPLKGFSWKPGVARNTSGIVLWSDVFLYNSPKGEKFAILLIDTQGLFDHDTPPAINSKIFSFTTLITSVQIFNLANMIQEDHLEYLQVIINCKLVSIIASIISYFFIHSSLQNFQDSLYKTIKPASHFRVFFS
jgi:atlastin